MFYCLLFGKDENREKEAVDGPFENKNMSTTIVSLSVEMRQSLQHHQRQQQQQLAIIMSCYGATSEKMPD